MLIHLEFEKTLRLLTGSELICTIGMHRNVQLLKLIAVVFD